MKKQTKVEICCAETIRGLLNSLNDFCKDKEIKNIQFLYKYTAMVVYEIIIH